GGGGREGQGGLGAGHDARRDGADRRGRGHVGDADRGGGDVDRRPLGHLHLDRRRAGRAVTEAQGGQRGRAHGRIGPGGVVELAVVVEVPGVGRGRARGRPGGVEGQRAALVDGVGPAGVGDDDGGHVGRGRGGPAGAARP